MGADPGENDTEPGADRHRDTSCRRSQRIFFGPFHSFLSRLKPSVERCGDTRAKTDDLCYALRVSPDRVGRVGDDVTCFLGRVDDNAAGFCTGVGGNVADRAAGIPSGLCGLAGKICGVTGDLDGTAAQIGFFGLGLYILGTGLCGVKNGLGTALDLVLDSYLRVDLLKLFCRLLGPAVKFFLVIRHKNLAIPIIRLWATDCSSLSV